MGRRALWLSVLGCVTAAGVAGACGEQLPASETPIERPLGDAGTETDGSAPADGGVDAALLAPDRHPLGAGDKNACVIRAGKLHCWGGDKFGTVGAGAVSTVMCDANDGGGASEPCRAAATEVSGIIGQTAVEQVSVGTDFACALDEARNVYCWGANGEERLGVPNSAVASLTATPTRVDLPPALGVSAGDKTACARVVVGDHPRAYCWGDDAIGQLGRGASTSRSPGPIAWDADIHELRLPLSNSHHACARAGGDIRCWGFNAKGSLGYPAGTPPDMDTSCAGRGWCSRQPTSVEPGASFSRLWNVGWLSACAQIANATFCWGENGYAQIPGTQSDGDPHDALVTAKDLPPNVVAIHGRYTHACALTQEGDVWCWGSNVAGELGSPVSADVCAQGPCAKKPTKVPGISNVAAIETGRSFTVAIDKQDRVWAWGANAWGQLGHTPGEMGDEPCPDAKAEQAVCHPAPIEIVFP